MQQEAPQKLYAAKGEHVTCVRGHHVCSVSKDVFYGDPRGNIFADWQPEQEPDKKTTFHRIRCAVCRGVWIRRAARGFQLHFAEGWR